MKENDNQIPIVKFLKKHKWLIILPALIMTFYISLPLVTSNKTYASQYISIKSETLGKSELTDEINSKLQYAKSDEFLKGIVTKYDLFPDENNEITKIEQLKKSIRIKFDNGDYWIGEVGISLDTIFDDKKGIEFITEISNDFAAEFEQNSNWQISKSVSKPSHAYPSIEKKIERVITNIIMSILLFSVPLIFLWETPNMFYSPRTKEMIFEPLKADWLEELNEAKLRKQTWKILEINTRYSFAFVAAMFQKTPIGKLIE